MFSAKIIFILLVAFLVFTDDSDAWRRRRRRRCPLQDCQVSSWSYWSSCSASQCVEHGSQSRSRTEETSPSCGGATCPELHETRQCYGTTPVDCQLSSWSEWSACTTPCGLSGTQSSSRHRIKAEQCGGWCASTFQKTRTCPDISCLNGGSLKDGSCFCKEGYTGDCCEKGADDHKSEVKSQKSHLSAGEIAGVCLACLFFAFAVSFVCYMKCTTDRNMCEIICWCTASNRVHPMN